MKSKIYFVLLSLALTGCTSFAIDQSSGQIGCPSSEISIVDDSGAGLVQRTWTAVCRGKTFYCTHTFDSHNTSCKESLQ
jgi:hypothetical protein